MSVGKQMLTGKIKSRQPPTFAAQATIIGAVGLDFRVRDGNGYGTHAMATGIKKLCQCLGHSKETQAPSGRGQGIREGTIWPSLAAY